MMKKAGEKFGICRNYINKFEAHYAHIDCQADPSEMLQEWLIVCI